MLSKIIKQCLPYSVLRVLYEMNGYFVCPGMRAELERNQKFRNLYNGQRCFILGNGPSLRQDPLDRLRGEIVFTCNNIGKSDILGDLVPFAHFITDVRMVKGEDTSVQRLRISENVRLLKRCNSSPKLFFGFGLRDFAIKSGLSKEFETYFIFQAGYDYSAKYSPNLCRSIPALPSVVQAEILAAIYMGFTEIYLLGCDCTGFLSLASALSDENSFHLSYAYSTDETDKKIISNVISQSSIADELSSYAQLFRNYRLMGTYCELHGVKLVNLSSGGILNELPRARLGDIVPEAAEGSR